jgi:hypothetical protein
MFCFFFRFVAGPFLVALDPLKPRRFLSDTPPPRPPPRALLVHLPGCLCFVLPIPSAARHPPPPRVSPAGARCTLESPPQGRGGGRLTRDGPVRQEPPRGDQTRGGGVRARVCTWCVWGRGGGDTTTTAGGLCPPWRRRRRLSQRRGCSSSSSRSIASCRCR